MIETLLVGGPLSGSRRKSRLAPTIGVLVPDPEQYLGITHHYHLHKVALMIGSSVWVYFVFVHSSMSKPELGSFHLSDCYVERRPMPCA